MKNRHYHLANTIFVVSLLFFSSCKKEITNSSNSNSNSNSNTVSFPSQPYIAGKPYFVTVPTALANKTDNNAQNCVGSIKTISQIYNDLTAWKIPSGATQSSDTTGFKFAPTWVYTTTMAALGLVNYYTYRTFADSTVWANFMTYPAVPVTKGLTQYESDVKDGSGGRFLWFELGTTLNYSWYWKKSSTGFFLEYKNYVNGYTGDLTVNDDNSGHIESYASGTESESYTWATNGSGSYTLYSNGIVGSAPQTWTWQ